MNYMNNRVFPKRQEAIKMQRANLPIYFRETDILEAINSNLITIICGETGSGKSTQVPQFLLEAGYGNRTGDNPGIVGITQSRRIAAVSLARRVAEELNVKLGS